jgi:hypothetical protein
MALMQWRMPTFGQSWAEFRKSTVRMPQGAGLFVGLTAIAAAVVVCLLLHVNRLSLGILVVFTTFGATWQAAAFLDRKTSLAFRLWTWLDIRDAEYLARRAQEGAPSSPKPGVGRLAAAATSEPESWQKVREAVVNMPRKAAREHVLLLADIYTKDEFDTGGLEAAIAELTDEEDRREWRVMLAIDLAFAEYLKGGNGRQALAEAAAKEGPFRLPTPELRLRYGLRRMSVFLIYFGAGLGGAVVGAIFHT